MNEQHENMQNVQVRAEWWRCRHCSIVFADAAEWLEHITARHAICHLCSNDKFVAYFDTHVALGQHQAIKHEANVPPDQRTCHECGRVFTHQHSLTQHLRDGKACGTTAHRAAAFTVSGAAASTVSGAVTSTACGAVTSTVSGAIGCTPRGDVAMPTVSGAVTSVASGAIGCTPRGDAAMPTVSGAVVPTVSGAVTSTASGAVKCTPRGDAAVPTVSGAAVPTVSGAVCSIVSSAAVPTVPAVRSATASMGGAASSGPARGAFQPVAATGSAARDIMAVACVECGALFANYVRLRQHCNDAGHRNECVEIPAFVCQCERRFPNIGQLRTHCLATGHRCRDPTIDMDTHPSSELYLCGAQPGVQSAVRLPQPPHFQRFSDGMPPPPYNPHWAVFAAPFAQHVPASHLPPPPPYDPRWAWPQGQYGPPPPAPYYPSVVAPTVQTVPRVPSPPQQVFMPEEDNDNERRSDADRHRCTVFCAPLHVNVSPMFERCCDAYVVVCI